MIESSMPATEPVANIGASGLFYALLSLYEGFTFSNIAWENLKAGYYTELLKKLMIVKKRHCSH